jgi:hypothetical protein
MMRIPRFFVSAGFSYFCCTKIPRFFESAGFSYFCCPKSLLVQSGFVIYSAGTTHLLYFNVINNFKNVRSRSNVRTLKMSVDTLKGGSSVSTFILKDPIRMQGNDVNIYVTVIKLRGTIT